MWIIRAPCLFSRRISSVKTFRRSLGLFQHKMNTYWKSNGTALATERTQVLYRCSLKWMQVKKLTYLLIFRKQHCETRMKAKAPAGMKKEKKMKMKGKKERRRWLVKLFIKFHSLRCPSLVTHESIRGAGGVYLLFFLSLYLFFLPLHLRHCGVVVQSSLERGYRMSFFPVSLGASHWWQASKWVQRKTQASRASALKRMANEWAVTVGELVTQWAEKKNRAERKLTIWLKWISFFMQVDERVDKLVHWICLVLKASISLDSHLPCDGISLYVVQCLFLLLVHSRMRLQY